MGHCEEGWRDERRGGDSSARRSRGCWEGFILRSVGGLSGGFRVSASLLGGRLTEPWKTAGSPTLCRAPERLTTQTDTDTAQNT